MYRERGFHMHSKNACVKVYVLKAIEEIELVSPFCQFPIVRRICFAIRFYGTVEISNKMSGTNISFKTSFRYSLRKIFSVLCVASPIKLIFANRQKVISRGKRYQ